MIGVFEIDRLEKELERTREKLEHVTEEMNHSCPDCEMARRLEVEQQAHERTRDELLAALRPVVRAAIRHHASWDRSQLEMAEHDALEWHWHQPEGGCRICHAVRALTPEQRARIEEESNG